MFAINFMYIYAFLRNPILSIIRVYLFVLATAVYTCVKMKTHANDDSSHALFQ